MWEGAGALTGAPVNVDQGVPVDEGRVADDIADDFVELNANLRESGGPDTALARLVQLAVGTIPGCDWAGISLWPPEATPSSLAVSGEVADLIDRLQRELGEGPCLSAALVPEPERIDDLSTDGRWPALAAAVLDQTPVRAILSLPLGGEPQRAALNLYSRQAGAFVGDTIATAALFAAHARVLLGHISSAENVGQLRNALNTSRQIGIAIGILMHTHKVTEEDAFGLLRVSSQHLNRKLRDVADDVGQTGALPAE